jgi:hypothetical protein
MLHIYAAFSAAGCCVLQRIALPVVSEWYQRCYFSSSSVATLGLHKSGESSAPAGPPPTIPTRVHTRVPARMAVAASLGSAVPRR